MGVSYDQRWAVLSLELEASLNMWAELAIAIVLVCTTGIVSVALLEYLVTRDFFFSEFLGLAKRVNSVQFILLSVLVGLLTIFFFSVPRLRVTNPSLSSTWNLHTMWSSMNSPAKVIVLILFVLSIYSFGIMIDRALMYALARNQSRIFVEQVSVALMEGNLNKALAIAERNDKSHIAKVVATGLSEFQSTSKRVTELESIEAAKRGLARSAFNVHTDMSRRLSWLAMVGSIAPFVGLFGTVVGILNAFKGIGSHEFTARTALGRGLSEAFVTTALGLFVAIPAVWMYNYFSDRLKAFDAEMVSSSVDLVNFYFTVTIKIHD